MKDTTAKPLNVLRTTLSLLTFRLSKEEFLQLDGKHLAFGLVCTWLVGIGRYWDHPSAKLLQYLGVGSVIYIFVLSLFLWLVLWPLRPKNWSYRNLLTFISLVSPPAMLYAIPVERWFSFETAASLNVWFLAIVATWRVALLIFYLKRSAELESGELIVATFLPLTVIVFALLALNLEGAVFAIMAGIPESRTANDAAYGVLFVLGLLSYLFLIPLLIAYFVITFQRWRRRKNSSQSQQEQHSTQPQ